MLCQPSPHPKAAVNEACLPGSLTAFQEAPACSPDCNLSLLTTMQAGSIPCNMGCVMIHAPHLTAPPIKTHARNHAEHTQLCHESAPSLKPLSRSLRSGWRLSSCLPAGRSLSLLDPTYASKYIPIIASVSEHQPPAWASYFTDLHAAALLMPAGLVSCFRPLTPASLFLILYGATAVYFSGVMVRLIPSLSSLLSVSSLAVPEAVRGHRGLLGVMVRLMPSLSSLLSVSSLAVPHPVLGHRGLSGGMVHLIPSFISLLSVSSLPS